MMKKYFFISMLVVSLLLGSTLGYLLTTLPSPQIPQEFVDLAVKEQAELGAIGSDILSKQLADIEAEVLASAQLLQEIFLNRSQIPQLPIYYHDLGLIPTGAQFPTGIFNSDNYEQLISLIGSAYQISPSVFSEEYRSEYIDQGSTSLDPHGDIPATVLQEIFQTSKLDYLLPTLYDSSSENLWLYFSSEKGYSRSYPFSALPKTWDGREGSWYQSAETGAKDVIILYDKSGSMEGERREGAVNATKNIIAGLGGRDRFNIVSFSDRISTFSDTLSLVSEENIDQVNNFVDSIIYGGTTDFDLAFETGYDLLREYGSSRSQPVIVFITDGTPTIGVRDNTTLIEKIDENDGDIDAEMILFSIGSDANQNLLSDIANAMEGTHIHVNSTQYIETSISSYQDFLSKNREASLIWSLPRTDIRNQGLVLTTSYPVIVNEQFKGVMAVDISVDSMKNFTRALEVSKGSYSFIFDLAGNNIIHPNAEFNFTNPVSERKSIFELENNSPEFIEMMLRAQVDISSTEIIEYETGAPERVVSLNPIGNTSMVFGLVSTLDNLVPDTVFDKLDTLSINPYSFIPGIALGLLGVFVLVWQRERVLKEEGVTQ